MKWTSRSELGWPASAAPSQATAKGVKIHWEGTTVNCDEHSDCVALVKRIRVAHLNHPTENYSDIAYNLVVCRHGEVFEGRGKLKRSGANGTQALNVAHYAILALLGPKGDSVPTPEMIVGLKDAITYMRSHGAGKEIKGHKDGHPTQCPGPALYALVTGGKLEPAAASKPPAKPKPSYAPYPGSSFFRLGRQHPLVTEMGKALVRAGYRGYKVGPGPTFTRSDVKAYAWWQRKLGYTGSDADGYPGKTSWDKLKVARPK